MRKREPVSEATLAAQVMEWLEGFGWDCYPEAKMTYGTGRADIAAVRGPVLWVIECKKSFTLSVLDQAAKWLENCNQVSIAIPYYKRGGGYTRNEAGAINGYNWPAYQSLAAKLFCRQNGIGVIEVRDSEIREVEPPRFFRDRRNPGTGFDFPRQNRLSLHPDMKRYAPGTTSDRGYSTPWRRTMDDAVEFVAKHPGCTLADLVAGIPHHYASAAGARGNLLHWLEKKAEVRLDRSVHPIRLYPLEAA